MMVHLYIYCVRMNKGLLCVPVLFLLTSCGGASQPLLDQEGVVSLGNGDIPIITGSGTSLDGSLESAMAGRKELDNKLARAEQVLAEVDAMDFGSQQAEITAKLEEIKAITQELSEIDDFFIQADDISQQVIARENRMQSFVTVPALPILVDLAGKYPETKVQGLARRGNDVFAIADKALYGPLQSGKLEDIKAIPFPEGISGARGSYSVKFGALYVSTTPSSVWKLAGDKLEPQTVENSGAWYPAGQFLSYGSNIYTFDPISKSFWKYVRKGDGTWGKPEIALDDAGVKDKPIQSIAIDGNVYALLYGGQLLKYTAGKPVQITLDRPLGGLSAEATMYTDINSSFLYILDPASKKVLRYMKKGTSLEIANEYTLDRQYKTMFVMPGDSTMYLADGSQIFALNLRQ